MTSAIEKFIWDLTYACPLRCVHCYSESGRRAARMLDRDEAARVVEVVIAARPDRMSLSGGEPLLVPWWKDAATRFHEAGITVTMFTSGWLMDDRTAWDLGASVSSLAVSVDGPDSSTHDRIRGRSGAFHRAMGALEVLSRTKRTRRSTGEACYTLGIDYTVTRSGADLGGLRAFVAAVTERFPELDFVRFGAVVPSGLAAEEDFAATEMLSLDELVGLSAAQEELATSAHHGAQVSVTDVRYFLPDTSLSALSERIALLEADGQMRAFPLYEAKVGNVLEDPLDVLWDRALAWRQEPFVVEQLHSVKTVADWARAARALDRRYGSPDDRARIAQRGPTAEAT